MKNKQSKKYVLFYLNWTIMFTIIIILNVQSEMLTLRMIFVAIIISATLSIPAIYYFFKTFSKETVKSDYIHLDLLPEEKLISKTNASLKKGVIRLEGILYLTDKHILFIGTEFFDRNKKLICLPLHLISGHELDDNYQLKIREDSGKEYIIALEGAFRFFSKLNNALE